MHVRTCVSFRSRAIPGIPPLGKPCRGLGVRSQPCRVLWRVYLQTVAPLLGAENVFNFREEHEDFMGEGSTAAMTQEEAVPCLGNP